MRNLDHKRGLTNSVQQLQAQILKGLHNWLGVLFKLTNSADKHMNAISCMSTQQNDSEHPYNQDLALTECPNCRLRFEKAH